MQVVNVDPVGAETLQARVARGENPTARKSAIVRRLRHDVADFGREDPTIALPADLERHADRDAVHEQEPEYGHDVQEQEPAPIRAQVHSLIPRFA